MLIYILDVPTVPLNLAVKVGPVVDFSWETPKSAGGEPIEGYVVQYRVKGQQWIDVSRTSDMNYGFEDLPTGEVYEFRVAAYNSVGDGDFAQYDRPVGIGGGKNLYFSFFYEEIVISRFLNSIADSF